MRKEQFNINIVEDMNMLLCLLSCSHVRWDKVAQMVTLANVRAESKVVMMETCRGLLLGAALERLGGRIFGCFLVFPVPFFGRNAL